MTDQTEYETRVTQLTVLPVGAEIFSEMATTIAIAIADEAGGEFVELRQSRMTEPGCVQIDATEWPALREAIDRMVQECRL